MPGDLLTDLQRAHVIADPWLDTTWIQRSALWSEHAWTYTTTFAVSDAVAAAGTSVAAVSDRPCNVRREGGQSLVIGGPSLVILEGKACNPL